MNVSCLFSQSLNCQNLHVHLFNKKRCTFNRAEEIEVDGEGNSGGEGVLNISESSKFNVLMDH